MDQEEFEAEVRRLRPYLVSLARWVVGRADAEDVVQTTLIRLWRRAPSFAVPDGCGLDERQRRVNQWMALSVLRSSLNWSRDRQRRLAYETRYSESVRTAEPPDPDLLLDVETILSPEDLGLLQQYLAGNLGRGPGKTRRYDRIKKILASLREHLA